MSCGSVRAGQSTGLTQLAIPPLPVGDGADAIAVTPDGTRLAVAIQRPRPAGAIQVITLATGATRTWTTSDSGTPEHLSWDDSGRRLAFFWDGDSASRAGLWLLDAGTPGNALLSGRRLRAADSRTGPGAGRAAQPGCPDHHRLGDL